VDPSESTAGEMTNGAAMAAYLGAAIGAFAMGLVVMLSEAGIFTAPSLYAPAGGLSGRTTIATVMWLIAWGALHQRWKNRQVEARRSWLLALVLIGLGVLFAFPPFWGVIP
jgi:hypothetical protein